MIDFHALPVFAIKLVFLASGGVVWFAGTQLAVHGDKLAEQFMNDGLSRESGGGWKLMSWLRYREPCTAGYANPHPPPQLEKKSPVSIGAISQLHERGALTEIEVAL